VLFVGCDSNAEQTSACAAHALHGFASSQQASVTEIGENALFDVLARVAGD
jgi:hypothetical protein